MACFLSTTVMPFSKKISSLDELQQLECFLAHMLDWQTSFGMPSFPAAPVKHEDSSRMDCFMGFRLIPQCSHHRIGQMLCVVSISFSKQGLKHGSLLL